MMSLRVLVVVDEANARSSAREFNRKLDWIKLRDYLADKNENRDLIEMVIYVGLPPAMHEWQEQRRRQENFLHWARTNGFLVVTKNGSPADDGKYKANVDVLMAIDTMDFAAEAKPDIVVLVTGDSDFAHLASKLRRRGIRVEVASVQQNLGTELKAAANEVIDLVPLFNSFQVLHGSQAHPIGGDDIIS